MVTKPIQTTVRPNDETRLEDNVENNLNYKLIKNDSTEKNGDDFCIEADPSKVPNQKGSTKNFNHYTKDHCGKPDHSINYKRTESKKHSYKISGLEGSGTLTTSLLLMPRALSLPDRTPNGDGKNSAYYNIRLCYPQSMTKLGNNFYVACLNDNNENKDNNLGFIVKYDESLTSEDLNALRSGYLFKQNPEKFKAIAKKIKVSRPMTMGHGQTLTNDGKNLRVVSHKEKAEKEAINYEYSGIITLEPNNMTPQSKLIWRNISYSDDYKLCRSRSYTRVMAWKPNTNTFYTVHQYAADPVTVKNREYANICDYEIYEHQIDANSTVSSKIKFRIQQRPGRYVKYDTDKDGNIKNPYFPCQGLAYDTKNDALVLVADGQYQAFKENKDYLGTVYVGNVNCEQRECEGMYFEGDQIYYLLTSKPEILSMKNPYAGDRFSAPKDYMKYVTIKKKGFGIYSDTNFKNKVTTSDDQYLKTFLAEKVCDSANGYRYLDLYDNANPHHRIGYIREDATALGHDNGTQAGGAFISVGKQGTITKSGYTIWGDLNFSKKRSTTDDKVNQNVWVLGKYNHINGNVYYSLYESEAEDAKWIGYVNANAVSLPKTLEDDEVEFADESVSLGIPFATYKPTFGEDNR